MGSDIGAQRREAGERTRRAIEAYFQNNPFAEQQECAVDLKLNPATVSRHCKVLKAERLSQLAERA